MFTPYEDKGKIFTEVIQKQPVAVIIHTGKHQIRGTIHVRPQVRFKDEMEKAERFLAVTDATVYGRGNQVLFQTRFMLVQCNKISWIFPVDESISSETAE